MQKIIIAAMSENRVIGNNNDIPWHLPNDFKRFKELTSGHHIIMGRKTFDSLPGVLPNRKHIVISRNASLQLPAGVVLVNSLENAYAYCESENQEKVFIIGGGEIYRQSLDTADIIELTIVSTNIVGDTFFPELDTMKWVLKLAYNHRKDEKHKFDYSYCTFINTKNIKSMNTIRAKFECVGIKDQPEYESKHVSFVPVIDGSEENKSFAKYTPSGHLELQISYDTEASNAFEIGCEYYLDITKAE